MDAGAHLIRYRTPAFYDRGRTRGGLSRNHGRMRYSRNRIPNEGAGLSARARGLGTMNDRPSRPGWRLMFRVAKREHHRTAPSPPVMRGPGVLRCCAAGAPQGLGAILFRPFQRFLQTARRRRMSPRRQLEIGRREICEDTNAK